MNFLTNDTLAELDSPSRHFRTTVANCQSPTKLRAKQLFLSNPFLAKRQSLDFDDNPYFTEPATHQFFIRPIPLSKNYTIENNEPETCENNQRVDEMSPISEKEDPDPKALKLKKTKSSTEVIVKTEILESNAEYKEREFISDADNGKKDFEIISSTKIEPVNDTVSIIIEIIDNGQDEGKTEKLIKERKNEKQLDRIEKKKRIASFYHDRNQLRSRISKVIAFWKGDNNFIPSVFRLVSLKQENPKILIEFQDFSLKGLSHIGEGFNDQLSESKLSKRINMIGQQYFDTDVYSVEYTETL